MWKVGCDLSGRLRLGPVRSCSIYLDKREDTTDLVWEPPKRPSPWWWHGPTERLRRVSTHLHAVVLVVDVLKPGDELAGIEAVSHRLVLIPLRDQ